MGHRRRRRELSDHDETPQKGFSPQRGKEFFLVALFVLPVMVGLNALTGAPVSVAGAVAFVIGFSALAGIVGMFTDNIGF
jgi:Flp pilus assembly protein TadB